MSQEDRHLTAGILSKPLTGTIFALSSGLSFFFLCMILPLVGPSGSKVEHAAQNKAAFLGALMFTLLLAALASYSKILRRKKDGGSLPHYSLGLCAICILSLIILLMDGFAI